MVIECISDHKPQYGITQIFKALVVVTASTTMSQSLFNQGVLIERMA
jgi:hypothetical protein